MPRSSARTLTRARLPRRSWLEPSAWPARTACPCSASTSTSRSSSEVLEHVVSGTQALRIGAKFDRNTDVGPLITEAEARRVEEWVDEARAAGATVHVGGQRRDAFYQPTVLTDVPADCRVIREEVFGPVVSIMPFIEVPDAIYAANDSEYGLQAGVFTESIDLALAIADKLHVGAVVINETSDVRIDSMPFGGFKKSGVGREGVKHAVREMTEPKSTIIKLGRASHPLASTDRHLRTECIMTTHKIAVIAGDGIGKEVVPAAIECLERIAQIHSLEPGVHLLRLGIGLLRPARADDAR